MLEAPSVSSVRAKPRVLLVDDEVAIARAYNRTLSAAGFEVATAADGEIALALLDREPFDVVLSDVWMPGLNGIGVLRAARARDLDVSVILVTGSPQEEDAAKAVASGALLYLVKPIELRTLVQVVENGVRLTRIARLKRAALAGTPGDKGLGDRAGLEVSFGRALDTLWMAFQPIVHWRERSVFGYEALLRSREPTLPHPPAVIDAAERLGELPRLGRTVRARAAAVAPSLPPSASMFVNVHPSDLSDDDLFSADAPLSRVAGRVVLEITERASLDTIADLEARIAALRALGYRIALDDFGDGYAGLTSFVRLRPDVVKLDKSVVSALHTSAVKQQLIGAMVSMCSELGAAIIGEGVETAEERDALSAVGCDLHQGFLFARPGEPFPSPTW